MCKKIKTIVQKCTDYPAEEKNDFYSFLRKNRKSSKKYSIELFREKNEGKRSAAILIIGHYIICCS